ADKLFQVLQKKTFDIEFCSKQVDKFSSHLTKLREDFESIWDKISYEQGKLSVLYKGNEIHKDTVVKFHQYLTEEGLVSVFPELHKLELLIITIPASSSSVERSFSAMKRIKSYLRNTQCQERLSSLALLSIEKSLLATLCQRPSFYDDVIDIFARKNRGTELVYKK
ncbi:hypothetical protein ANN_03396, partial [Periplaneta americana]